MANLENLCPQAAPLVPARNGDIWKAMGELVEEDNFQKKAIEWLSKAVQVPSEVFDEMDAVGVDPRWEVFGDLHRYLESAFPLVHKTLSLKKVNTFGLLYEWTGSDTTLKPVMLAAHQDVVPVHPDTVNEWVHPPFSGYFDGELIWGRGSNDDKSGLIGILIAIESLIEKGFKPTRSIVLAFGFDEEASGLQGAFALSEAIVEIYGEDSIAFIVDEGGGFATTFDGVFATPGIAEKGYLDLRIEVAAPGGHSSVPPAHTSIGMIAAMLAAIENNPPVSHLSRDDIPYSMFQCFAAHGKVPKRLEDALRSAALSDDALKVVEEYVFAEQLYYSTVTTTQAIDLINGGVKTNALPEQVNAVVNHRISILSSVNETRDRDLASIKPVVEGFNLSLTSFGELLTEPGAPAKGSVVLSDAFDNALAPAPRTPLTGPESRPYQLLSGTIKSTYNAHRGLDDANAISVSPGMSTGNTDTRYYWSLTPHIFRYNHKNSYDPKKRAVSGVHTTNENVEAEAFFEMVRFFSTLILNADEYEL
ncbi:carboxypeptidase S [Cylindrobasidium torrendii FP15055 ss-10]|uniref:Carboxypeptidase S n=1 Tax=Cylindrobasidium torrendii FP15055 ss-10 TaxID=1314674 RepID=A0A0D7B4D6_9AGAR|nr:carboxypeptidase S [Cylindrobasidium torrendii FP15055 ss-10]